MKTKGLSFLEAVEALEKGKCLQIKSCHSKIDYTPRCGILYPDDLTIIALSVFEILGEWELIGVKPRTEEREFKYWVAIFVDREVLLYTKPTFVTYKTAQHVFEHTQKYTYTFPEED